MPGIAGYGLNERVVLNGREFASQFWFRGVVLEESVVLNERQREERIECWSPTERGVNRMLVANRNGFFFPPSLKKKKLKKKADQFQKIVTANISVKQLLIS